jgi:hypothetical protein
MPNCADPARPSPDARLREVAAILATAILRLRGRAALPNKVPSDSAPTGLEVSPETRLSVHRG